MTTNNSRSNTEALDTQLSEKLMKLLPELTDTQHIKLGQFIQAYVDSECLKATTDELQEVLDMALTNYGNTKNYDMKTLANYCEFRIKALNTGGNSGKS